jgi:two-component system CheB/CheR fusion protein
MTARQGDDGARLRSILDAAVNAILTIDDHGRIESANAAVETVFGWKPEELIGQDVVELMAEPHRSRHADYIRRYLATGERRIIGLGREVEAVRRDGTSFPIDLSVGEVEIAGRRLFTGIVRDVSERKDAERMLAQASRLEAVGRLAGGIAHDFNNLLTSIRGSAQLLARRLPEDDRSQRAVGRISEAAERGAALVSHMLAFARRQPTCPQPVELNTTVRQMSDLVARLIAHDVEVVLDLTRESCWVLADPAQVDQLVMNLVVNASDAMPRGGDLRITTRCVDVDPARAAEQGIEPGRCVEMRVADTGTGIAPEHVEHIFEPFFTTKDVGQGTGLGLSTVYGVVKQNGWGIEVESRPDEGTCFTLLMPLRDEPAPEPQRARSAAPASSARGRILLVEDDALVREHTSELLQDLGHEVSAVDSPAAALAVARESDRPFALLITDVLMPRLSGPELIERLRERLPALQVLFVSGRPADELDLEPGQELLHKPYGNDELEARVRVLLERGQA